MAKFCAAVFLCGMPGNKRSTDVVKEGLFLLPHMALLYTSGYAEGELLKGGRLDANVMLLTKPSKARSSGQACEASLDDVDPRPDGSQVKTLVNAGRTEQWRLFLKILACGNRSATHQGYLSE